MIHYLTLKNWVLCYKKKTEVVEEVSTLYQGLQWTSLCCLLRIMHNLAEIFDFVPKCFSVKLSDFVLFSWIWSIIFTPDWRFLCYKVQQSFHCLTWTVELSLSECTVHVTLYIMCMYCTHNVLCGNL